MLIVPPVSSVLFVRGFTSFTREKQLLGYTLSKRNPNKENNTWASVDVEFLFECLNQYLASEGSERMGNQVEHAKNKIRIYKQPCIILFII